MGFRKLERVKRRITRRTNLKLDVRFGSLADIAAAIPNRKQTSPKTVHMSAKCQQQTNALQ
jgi:hypothetical protein